MARGKRRGGWLMAALIGTNGVMVVLAGLIDFGLERMPGVIIMISAFILAGWLAGRADKEREL